MPTIYILKNVFSIKFFNSLDKILKHINKHMNLKQKIEIFNSNIEIDSDGNHYITLYNYEYDIMKIHIFEVEKIENISFIEYSVDTNYDYDIYPCTLSECWNNVITDVRKNYIKNKNICVSYHDESLLNCKKIYIQCSIKFAFRSYTFINDIIYE